MTISRAHHMAKKWKGRIRTAWRKITAKVNEGSRWPGDYNVSLGDDVTLTIELCALKFARICRSQQTHWEHEMWWNVFYLSFSREAVQWVGHRVNEMRKLWALIPGLPQDCFGPWHAEQTSVKHHCFFLLMDSALEPTSKGSASGHFINTDPDNGGCGK